ncbi:MAG: DUF3726 domain-containing protein [Hyphomicrobiaceae bacterium]|nr:DUF3726 domain-containing protein [Hyphomicrobiaceae bacterium]
MSLSFNEIEAAALKAARGAGFSWGLAEEAGFAARWLAERGLDWLPALLAVCEAQLSRGETTVGLSGHLLGPGAGSDSLCPLRVGAWIADLGAVGEDGYEVHKLRHPILLLPFLDLASRQAGPIALSILPASGAPSQVFVVCQGALHADRADAPCPTLVLASVQRVQAPAVGASRPLLARPAAVDPALRLRLAALEARTYVPASRHSRLAGAGAGLTDND